MMNFHYKGIVDLIFLGCKVDMMGRIVETDEIITAGSMTQLYNAIEAGTLKGEYDRVFVLANIKAYGLINVTFKEFLISEPKGKFCCEDRNSLTRFLERIDFGSLNNCLSEVMHVPYLEYYEKQVITNESYMTPTSIFSPINIMLNSVDNEHRCRIDMNMRTDMPADTGLPWCYCNPNMAQYCYEIKYFKSALDVYLKLFNSYIDIMGDTGNLKHDYIRVSLMVKSKDGIVQRILETTATGIQIPSIVGKRSLVGAQINNLLNNRKLSLHVESNDMNYAFQKMLQYDRYCDTYMKSNGPRIVCSGSSWDPDMRKVVPQGYHDSIILQRLIREWIKDARKNMILSM